ncbi:MAG: hypothetical protein AAB036_02355 [Elusimicrobiota bacterium]
MKAPALRRAVLLLAWAIPASGAVENSIARARRSLDQIEAARSPEEQRRAAALLADDMSLGEEPRPAGALSASFAVNSQSALNRAESAGARQEVAQSRSKAASGFDEELQRRFREILRVVRGGWGAPIGPEAKRPRYLLVKGLYGDHISDYMEGNLRRLRSLGLEADFVPVHTDSAYEENLKLIEQAVAAEQSVVLLGHSRGGVLIHDWYRAAPTASKAKVRRVILVQAPLWGSEAADWISDRWYARAILNGLALLPGWEDPLEGVLELTSSKRKEVMMGLPELSPGDLKKIFTVASSFDSEADDERHQDMAASERIIRAMTGRSNDGLVAVESALVPGSDAVFMEDFDHEDSVLEHPGWFKRLRGRRPLDDVRVGDFTEALVRAAVQP